MRSMNTQGQQKSAGMCVALVPDHSAPVKVEEQMHSSFHVEKPGATARDTQQADLLQVMQDVTGRVIANSALHLRKRAAKLCLEELKEYKRSKALNILTASTERPGSDAQPSSSSYLISAVPRGHGIDGSSALASKHGLLASNHTATRTVAQGEAAAPTLQPNSAAQKLSQTASVQNAGSAPIHKQSSMQAIAARHRNLNGAELSAAASTGAPLHGMQASAGTGRADTFTMNLPPVSPSMSHVDAAVQMQPYTEKQQWLSAPNQRGCVTSWPQGQSKPLLGPESWGSVTSTRAANYDQGKIGCAHSFPFSKHPCTVIW